MRIVALALPWILAGCLGLGGESRDPVEEAAVVSFADRIERFYAALERVPLDVLMTYEDGQIRSFFEGPREFTDYYASLASQVRASPLRHATAERVEIREFRFDGADRAQVDLLLVGPHGRGLLFWDVEILRTDTWHRVDDTWVVSPERL